VTGPGGADPRSFAIGVSANGGRATATATTDRPGRSGRPHA